VQAEFNDTVIRLIRISIIIIIDTILLQAGIITRPRQTPRTGGGNGQLFLDPPTDQPKGRGVIQVQNQRDPLADSKPAWHPILRILHSRYSELTRFVQERPFTPVKTVKKS